MLSDVRQRDQGYKCSVSLTTPFLLTMCAFYSHGTDHGGIHKRPWEEFLFLSHGTEKWTLLTFLWCFLMESRLGPDRVPWEGCEFLWVCTVTILHYRIRFKLQFINGVLILNCDWWKISLSCTPPPKKKPNCDSTAGEKWYQYVQFWIEWFDSIIRKCTQAVRCELISTGYESDFTPCTNENPVSEPFVMWITNWKALSLGRTVYIHKLIIMSWSSATMGARMDDKREQQILCVESIRKMSGASNT